MSEIGGKYEGAEDFIRIRLKELCSEHGILEEQVRLYYVCIYIYIYIYIYIFIYIYIYIYIYTHLCCVYSLERIFFFIKIFLF